MDQIMIPGCYSRLKRKGNERIQEKKKSLRFICLNLHCELEL